MSVPAVEDIRELGRLLVIAGEQGETRSFESLREELALGHDDLAKALDRLRERGMASEVTPGEWSSSEGDEPLEDDAGPVVVSVPEPDDSDAATEAAAAALRRRDGAKVQAREPQFVVDGAPDVRLTRSIANALDAAALGQIVKAGLDGVPDDEMFILEVLP